MVRITIQDVANLAGVSPATVSRALHSPQLVSPDTLEKVRRIMREQQYVYNAAAADFSRSKSSVLGVLVPTTAGTVFAETVGAIEEYAYERGHSVMVMNTRYDAEIEASMLRQAMERRLAGLILTGYCRDNQDLILEMAGQGLPCLIVWETLPQELPLGYVGIDNYQAAYEGTAHLLGLGHSRVGLIVGPCEGFARARRRLDGYRAALEAFGVPRDPRLEIEKQPSMLAGKEAMARLLALPDPPTAVFAASDFLAIGALAAAREAGLDVPGDVSILGFDDIEFTAYCHPPLTTVRVPGKQIGRMAASLIMESIAGEDAVPRRLRLDTELVLRRSCSPPRRPAAP